MSGTEKFSTLTAVAVPLLRANIDTDAIIPSREMKSVSKTGLADGLFAGWRYTEIGGRMPNPDFALNQAAYAGAKIILGGENFGCGSSREHAVWALREYGFRVVIAPSFAPIFSGNCIRNGIAPICLAAASVALLAEAVSLEPQRMPITVDLPAQQVRLSNELLFTFAIDAESKEMLLEGLDAIDLAMKNALAIEGFLQADRLHRPWIYIS